MGEPQTFIILHLANFILFPLSTLVHRGRFKEQHFSNLSIQSGLTKIRILNTHP